MPLPTHRLASAALDSLSVDAELSPLVRRSFSLSSNLTGAPTSLVNGVAASSQETLTILKTEYRATTNRMLRVAVNGFMESLGVVLAVIEHLDLDVLADELTT